MIGWDESDNGQMDVIADAVRTYPLAAVPPDLASAIMLRVQRATPKPRFELKWIDMALGLFGASMTGLVWLLWQWLQTWQDWQNIFLPSLLVSFDSTALAFGAIGAIGGLLVLTVCLLLALVLLVPSPVVQFETLPRK